MRVLVIDDAPDARLVARALLEKLGCQVIEVGDAPSAITWLEREGPADLALVDWHMQPINGYSLLRALRANPRWQAMPLALVSGERGTAYQTLAKEAGCLAALAKPLRREDVVALLHGLRPSGPSIPTPKA